MQKIIGQIAAEIRVTPAQVQAAVELLDSGLHLRGGDADFGGNLPNEFLHCGGS